MSKSDGGPAGVDNGASADAERQKLRDVLATALAKDKIAEMRGKHGRKGRG